MRSDLRVLWRLRKYGLMYGWQIAALYFCMALSLAAALVIPRLLGQAIDDVITQGLRRDQFVLALAVLGLSFVRGLFGFFQNYLSEWIQTHSAFHLRADLFRKMLDLSFSFYDQQRTGDLMVRVTEDVRRVQSLVSLGTLRVALMVLLLCGIVGIMLATNWRLAVVVCSFLLIFSIWALQRTDRLRELWTKVQAETGRTNSVLQENLANTRVVKTFGAESLETAKFDDSASEVARLTFATQHFWAVRGSLFTFISIVAIGAVLWLGGREVAAARLTPGELATFVIYMNMIRVPIWWGAGQFLSLAEIAASARRIMEVLAAEPQVRNRPGSQVISLIKGHVQFENVSFSYIGTDAAIKDLTFEARPGELVAILGPSGSGKSTIGHLIPRFYDVTAGRVLIDGVDVRDIEITSLRRSVAIVLQDVFVFSGSWYENIAYGVNNATPHQVESSAKTAALHDYIEGLPDKYNTLIGERGMTLSGGQRQRLALARTLLTNPPMLILDDSTSNVDVGTEYEIQQALNQVVKGRTTFVIAHRLSTVRKADLVLVVEEGEIVERGTHDELLALDGYYRRIHDLQLTSNVGEVLRHESEAMARSDIL